MDIGTINLIVNAVIVLIGGGAFGVWLLHRREMPKAKADAQLIQSEADERDWGRFQKEIGRLEERITRLERDNEALRDDALKSRQRESNLEQKVRSQKAHIDRLERRLAGMERIFKIHGITPAMQEELDKLERVEVTTSEDDGSLANSDALNSAKGAVRNAKRTLASTRTTCDEVKRSETDEEGDGK